MFLEKIRNSFCFSETKNVSATNVSYARKRGNIEHTSAKMCSALTLVGLAWYMALAYSKLVVCSDYGYAGNLQVCSH